MANCISLSAEDWLCCLASREMINGEIKENCFPPEQILRACYSQCLKDFLALSVFPALCASRFLSCAPSLLSRSICVSLPSVTKGTISFPASRALPLHSLALSPSLVLSHVVFRGDAWPTPSLQAMCCNCFWLEVKKINTSILNAGKHFHSLAAAIAAFLNVWMFTWRLCLQLRFVPEPIKTVLGVFFFMSRVFAYCYGTSQHLHVWQLAAGICCEGQSLCLWRELIRCADVCPILFSAYSVNTICAFHFSRLLFRSTPSASIPPVNPSPPLAVSTLCPRPPPLFSIPLVLDRCKSRAFCCKGWYFWSQVTHTFMFQAAMTVTDMYIMLSDSVRHASSLLLFIWKLFNVSGPCVVETYSDSFLYHDALFAGVDTLLHMNMKHILHLNSSI